MADRTHTCGELTREQIDQEVTLIGWAQRIRNHGGKKFIDLRDRYGKTQIVFDPDITEEFEKINEVRREYLLKVGGTVRNRPEGTINEKMTTGEVEIIISSFTIVNSSEPLPFDIEEEHASEVNEDLRLEYRYLDLRRPEMLATLKRRHKFIKRIRDIFDENDFMEVETPNLTKSTPEGSRDFLVPYRKKPGHFFALPQSPQLFKQMLMVSGIDRYYQVASCFRDEDLRKDRQYEHKQLDMEVSFINQQELFSLLEEIFVRAFREVYNIEVPSPFPQITYDEAMSRYGSDKPDLRIQGLELVNISDIAANCQFGVFNKAVEQGGLVKGLKMPNGQETISRKEIDRLVEFCQQEGAKGMAWMKVMANGEIESSISKFFSQEELKTINERFETKEGDLLFFIADTKDTTNDVLDALRRHLAETYDMIDQNQHHMAWIVDFPLFKWDDNADHLDFEHSPFTMPHEDGVDYLLRLNKDDIPNEKEKLLSMTSDCYDLVYNGVEIGSGAMRIFLPELQAKLFELMNYSQERIEESFGWFMKAYKFGAPPHRGMGLGIERMMMMAEGKESIREVIPFPRNKHGYDPLTHSPAPVSTEQLKELGIELSKKEEKK